MRTREVGVAVGTDTTSTRIREISLAQVLEEK